MEVSILNRILNFILARGWTDYDNFSSKLSIQIVRRRPKNRSELINILNSFKTPFFKLNQLNKSLFIENFPVDEILYLLQSQIDLKPLTFIDVFKGTDTISIDTGKLLVPMLKDIDERTIQDTLQNALRDINATNATERQHDSVLEVADREHFSVIVNGVTKSFALIVKGYKSIKTKTVTAEGVMHQITRAYNRTYPDHLLLVLAKNPSDSLLSELVQYGKSIGNEHLVILCDPVNLARFLKYRNVL